MVMLGMLISGTANTILMKIQNETVVSENPRKTFNHPFVQCAIMFIGELLCLGVYGVKKFLEYRKKKSGHGSDSESD
jgi:drug/metabolite transporter (DMT)-like permease